mmetsp:Transcript_165614/g.317961  ORF Transcript_165614/g.317961 Transcript_165614/m.317961 type:complete len:287 (-) Transcript_165614:116-976(-)
MSLSKRSGAADRGFLVGGSLLSRSHGIRSNSCSNMQKHLGNKQQRRTPLEPLSPNQRSTPDLTAALAAKTEFPALPPAAPSSPSGASMSPSNKYLAPLPPKDAPSRLLQDNEVTTLALALPQPISKSTGKLSATVDMTEFQPKRNSKLQVSKRGVLDLTRRLCMSIPRPLPTTMLPRHTKMSTALLRLHGWQQQINPRVPRPSGMLACLARLREAVLKNHSEMQKNRSALQALRESFPNSPGRDSQALPLPALDNVVSNRPSSPEADHGEFSITCSIDTPLVARIA